ncbi:MAG: radical SAM protein [Clostridia bacterium]|nr:radical SAM protein [Clostridia bacterium]
MKVTGVIDEDFNHYQKPSLLISMPKCNGKCGKDKCHNSHLMREEPISIDDNIIITKYLSNDLTSAIVFAGLEPFDSWYEMYGFIKKFRQVSNDDIVIYTGYTEEELFYSVGSLIEFPNIIVKFGRYIEGHEKHYDAILGMDLASDNQYAKVIGGDYFAENRGNIYHPR